MSPLPRYRPVVVVFRCGHDRMFRYSPPKRGARIYCPQCEDMTHVAGLADDWRAACNDCTFKRTTSRGNTIRYNIMQHLRTHPLHHVTVWRIGERDAWTVRLRINADGLPMIDGLDSPDTLPLKDA